MRRISIQLSDKREWIKIYNATDASVFVATNEVARAGETVRVDIQAGASGPRVVFRGVVTTANARDGTGWTLALGAEERAKIDYLSAYVRGGQIDLRVRRRLPIRLQATYGGLTGPRQRFTRDLNEEGVFVIDDEPLPEGSEINLLLDVLAADGAPVNLRGTIVHTVVVDDEDVPGMGIRFEFAEGQAKTLSALVDQLEARFLRNDLPEDCLE